MRAGETIPQEDLCQAGSINDCDGYLIPLLSATLQRSARSGQGRLGGQGATGEGSFLRKRRGEREQSRHCARQTLERVHEGLLGDEGGSDA